VQGRTADEGARTWWIRNPRVLLRDVAPPAVSFTSLPTGWINATTPAIHVAWSAADNLGAAGITDAALLVGDRQVWAGGAGVGDFEAEVPLQGVPDGHHALQLQVHGNGTPPGAAAALISVDRTAPVVRDFTVIPTLEPGQIAASWSASDELSDVAGSYLQVNTAPEGSRSGEWTSLAGTQGRGPQALATINAVPAGQGLHAVRLVTYDGAGNGQVTTWPEQVLVDTVAPQLSLDALPAAAVGEARVSYAVDDDLRERVGLGPVEISVNTATDGSETGDWVTVAAHAVGPGPTSEIVPLRGFASGRHRLRVRAHNAGFSGAALVADQSGDVTVDSTSPTIANVSFQPAGSNELTVSWIADDIGAGVAAAAVQALEDGRWHLVANGRFGDGPGSLVVPADKLTPGVQRLRLIVVDAAGNAAAQAQSEGGSRIDPSPPTVSGLTLAGSPPTLSWTQSDPGGAFGDCPTTVAVDLGGSEGWTTIVSMRLGEGPQSIVLPVADLPDGAHRVRVTACDEAGNQASAETGGLMIAPHEIGAARAADDPDRYRGAHMTLRVTGGAAGPADARVIDAGQTLLLRGQLRGADGRPLPATRIEVQAPRGVSLGDTLTDRAGRFRLPVRPALGPIRVGVPVGARLITARGGLVRVTVRPRITLTASTRVARPGGDPVAFRGRFMPSPQQLGLHGRKRVDLLYRHPESGDWTVLRTSRLAADGGFSIPWRFQSKNYTFTFRVRATAELGWPFDETDSNTVDVAAGPG
jgi:hypothetical protein